MKAIDVFFSKIEEDGAVELLMAILVIAAVVCPVAYLEHKISAPERKAKMQNKLRDVILRQAPVEGERLCVEKLEWLQLQFRQRRNDLREVNGGRNFDVTLLSASATDGALAFLAFEKDSTTASYAEDILVNFGSHLGDVLSRENSVSSGDALYSEKEQLSQHLSKYPEQTFALAVYTCEDQFIAYIYPENWAWVP